MIAKLVVYWTIIIDVITIDLSKQQKLDADPKTIQQVTFGGNLDQAAGSTMFFIIEEAKETVLDFSLETLWKYSNFIFCFNIKWLNITL